MAWAIEAFDLVRVWASTERRHVRSQRVMEKLGMRRESVRVDGKDADQVVYGLEIPTR
jgi:RimJ/RimL family protein N-acetyltransferase